MPVPNGGYGTGASPTLNLSGVGASAPASPQDSFSTMATGYLSGIVQNDIWQNIPIFMGYHHEPRHNFAANRPMGGGGYSIEDHNTPSHTGGKTPTTASATQLLGDFDKWTRDQYLQFKNKLVAAGLLPASADPATVRDMYASILQNSVTQQQVNHVLQSPMDYINNLIRLNGLNPNKIGSDPNYTGASATPKTQTTTYKSVYDMDPSQAEDLLTQMLQSKLGRDPSKAEIEDFADAVKTRSLHDPTVTRSVSHTDAQGNTTTSQHTVDSGFQAADAQMMAQHRAENSPDYKSYQAVSTYFPALVQALGATV